MTKIENEIQYQAAMERIEELLPLTDDNTPINDKNLIELQLLSNLVADYDEEHYPIKAPTLAEVIKLRMHEMNLNQTKVSQLLEISPSRVSDYLTGKSEPTLKVAHLLCTKLKIDPKVVVGI